MLNRTASGRNQSIKKKRSETDQRVFRTRLENCLNSRNDKQNLAKSLRVLHQTQFLRDDTIFFVGAIELPEATLINDYKKDFKDLEIEGIESKIEFVSLNLRKKFQVLFQNK